MNNNDIFKGAYANYIFQGNMLHHQRDDFFSYMVLIQESIFSTIGKPMTETCLQGYNGTIFA
jgi:hypothetical protein